MIFERILLIFGDFIVPLLLLWAFWGFFIKPTLLFEDKKSKINEAKLIKEFTEKEADKIKEEINNKTETKNNKIKQFIKKGEKLK